MKRLTRSSSDRVLGGVCGGIGDYLNVDPNLIRVAWIAFSLFGGAGILTYLAALVIVPADGASPDGGRSFDVGRAVGLLLIVAGFVLVFRRLDVPVFSGPSFGFWSPGLFVPVLLFVVGVFLVWPRTREAIGISSQRRAYRSVTNRVLAGVCGGLAEQFGWDASLIRVLWVFLTMLTSGLFLVAYVLLIIVMPEEVVATPETETTTPPPPPAAAAAPAAAAQGAASPPPPPHAPRPETATEPSPGAPPPAAGTESAPESSQEQPASDEGGEPSSEDDQGDSKSNR